MFELIEDTVTPAKIKVIGLGGGGVNAVDRIIEAGLTGVELIAANTDIQHLELSKAPEKIQLGPKTTYGMGAGHNPEIGEKAALESKDIIEEKIKDADMLFIAAGMGGGTGTGAAPVVAEIAKQYNILTVAVVTKPFLFEGNKKLKQAEEGIEKLSKIVDSIIVVNNENILKTMSKKEDVHQALKKANDILRYAVQGITELITKPGYINCDFADIKSVMKNKGRAVMGLGIGKGENKARESLENAINSPLLDNSSIEGATGVLINITTSDNFLISELNTIVSGIKERLSEDVNLIFGYIVDRALNDEIRVTLIATGFNNSPSSKKEETIIQQKIEVPFNLNSKAIDKPAFQRYRRNIQTTSPHQKIVKDLQQFVETSMPQLFIDVNDEENYDIPAFIRQRIKH